MRRACLIVWAILIGLNTFIGRGEELPVETFFRNYQYREAELSPDGNYLAVLAPNSNRVGLAVIDLKTQTANWAYGSLVADVGTFFWVKTNRLIFRWANKGYIEQGFLAVDRDGKKAVRLVGEAGRLQEGIRVGPVNGEPRSKPRVLTWGTRYLGTIPSSPDEILVSSFDKAVQGDGTLLWYQNVFRMNLYTGKMTMDTPNPGQVVKWLVDHNGVVRIGVARDGTRIRILHRSNPKAKWETLTEFDYEHGIEPIGFQSDNRTLLVRSTGDEETEGIYTFDVETKKITRLGFRHAEADVEHWIFSGKKHAIAGVHFDTDRPQVFWFDPEFKHWQEAVDEALPNAINHLVSVPWDDSKAIYLSQTDRNPGTYYLLDTSTMRLKKLFDRAEWIDPEKMAPMKPIEYKSRDGLTIHGYLTLPLGSTGTNLPLIVNPHGGPTARDTWGFDPDVQFLANRGYAVLRMNFRGSTGYGKSFLKAGFREWGLKQQDDITDGVKWAIEQGIADPKRICIFGASYGGYAALVGLEQTPELYRCGISYAGVTDIIRTLKKSVSELKVSQAIAIEQIGDVKDDKEHLKDVSPLSHVDKIQVPVFLAHGENDDRVPIDTARDLAKALKKQGKLYDFMVRDEEGHGFHQEANKIAFWTKVDAFLKANLNN